MLTQGADLMATDPYLAGLAHLGQRVVVDRHHGVGPGASHGPTAWCAADAAGAAHERGITYEEIAAAMGLDVATICSWLSARWTGRAEGSRLACRTRPAGA